MVNNKRILIIGHNHYGRVPMSELREIIITSEKDKPACKRCGSTENIMLNGYCFECDEELSKQFNNTH